jgi:hypothetical protein
MNKTQIIEEIRAVVGGERDYNYIEVKKIAVNQYKYEVGIGQCNADICNGWMGFSHSMNDCDIEQAEMLLDEAESTINSL